MSDNRAPSSGGVVVQLADRRTRACLARLGLQITGAPADADDLVGDALEHVLARGDPPGKKWTFLTRMTYLMRHIWDQQRRAVRFDREVPDEDVTRGKKGVSREPRADDELDRRRTLAILRQLVDQLLADIRDRHPVAVRCFELGAQGIEDRVEQAQILGVDLEKINDAHETLRYHGRRVRREWELAEEQRMQELRDASRPSLREVES